MNRIADDISENDAKVVLCCNFTSSIAVSLKTFFSSHGYVSMFRSSLNEVITLGRSIPASLICIYVSGYDTSWIRLITIMNVDPLFFVSPLLLISQNVRSLLFFLQQNYHQFFAQQQKQFHFYLLTDPISFHKLSCILRTLETPISIQSQYYKLLRFEYYFVV